MTSSSARWWVLVAATLGFTAAAFLVPWHAASAITGLTWAGPHDLAGSVGDALSADWAAAVSAPGGQASSALTDPTRFWRWFHIVKAALALAALVSAVLLVTHARRARRSSSTTARRFVGTASTLIGGLAAAVGVVLVVANVQGAIAPLSSVLSFLPLSDRSPTLVDAVRGLEADLGSANPTPTAAAILSDFASYHAVVALLLAAVAVLAGVTAVRALRARRWGSGVVLAATVTIVALLTLANISTALAPTGALQSFLSGVV
jgi:hypothetical protein